MKKFASMLVAVMLVAALAFSAFAFSYDASSGTITGSYSSDGVVEIYVNGSVKGGGKLNYKVPGDGTYTIEVYENGTKVKTQVITIPTEPVVTEEPTVAPTAEPGDPTAKPTKKPSSSSSSDDDVPKTSDNTVAISLVLIVMAAAAAILVIRKRARNH